jgi:MSHA biogenesis protein MshJ
MKQQLQKYAEAIDAMALRERVMLFLAVALVLMTLLQIVLLDPMLSQRNRLTTQISQQEDETKAMQSQIQALVQPNTQDPDEINRDRLKSLREQMAQLERQLESRQKQFVAPARMVAMLESMVGKNPRLQLVSLRNLPVGSLSQPGAAATAGTAGGQPRAAGAREIFRHTVELNVRGSYFDLLDYLVALEGMQGQVFWEGLELSVAEYPLSVLKLTIYTLSPDKSWLTV